ncbi:MAG TPA: UDP-N-acetylglucosamine--N-acetylmuramyl-(pentapeptide) pyrophosphoryl-undecaprenol N-acetylglucosamine transferase [Thermotogota bacterium]|mgnify:CR=1 FL=1|nr:UDP-N-acetylglucosamine--N-acetylmuramyl-(pentapeptide) pyrophosphoryl-undecaprenol N-acetylglucosamine transferase [Thermotogota bacterium]HPJ87692.1 UDP-N-acetylglucosamine--N-acetylmuramyl-(pentapeptide) pyrophosphoryl-undecaprenol N-acetylglucosamine transferase [Thermotogota bacterium]HPR94869.1 UDP-N-acetylglucosamine--N-acetylmuramyl-(pentapeptide) pyrophosphoryl-undecaprenol N-acetylglucosamine transferase [Thermotogota bacterium]
MRIAVAGGVTGGHIYPAVAVLNYFKEMNEKIEVLYFATPHGLENKEINRLFPDAKIVKLEIGGLIRPAYNPKNLSVIFNTLKAYTKCVRELKRFNADFSFITGGYISVPLGMASRKLNIPNFIHEQNAIAGVANKFIAPKAAKIFISFEESARDFNVNKAHKIKHTGNPVRKITMKNKEIFGEFGLDPEKRVVLVAGGSHGSDFINNIMLQVYQNLEKEKKNTIEFLHSCGDERILKDLNRFPFVHAVPYILDMHNFLASADAAIIRGGATTVAEVIAYGVPPLIIPWSGAAENHQLINAISLEKNGAGFYLEEREANAFTVYKKLQSLLEKEVSMDIKEALRTLRPEYDPSKRIYQEIMSELR